MTMRLRCSTYAERLIYYTIDNCTEDIQSLMKFSKNKKLKDKICFAKIINNISTRQYFTLFQIVVTFFKKYEIEGGYPVYQKEFDEVKFFISKHANLDTGKFLYLPSREDFISKLSPYLYTILDNMLNYFIVVHMSGENGQRQIFGVV